METKLSKTPIQVGDYFFSIDQDPVLVGTSIKNYKATVSKLNDMIYRIYIDHPDFKYIDMDTYSTYLEPFYINSITFNNFSELPEYCMQEEYNKQFKSISIKICSTVSKFNVFKLIQLKWSSCILMIVDPLK